MLAYLIYALLVSYGSCQYVKSGVKGGYGGHGFQEHFGEDLVSLFGNRTYYGNQGHNQNEQGLTGVGVCTTEVPTASLVRDQSHVPTGNGSRPDLSVIKTCCKGYIRNVHNPTICDPVCTHDCVNALCSAPDTCTCFPDHVKNLAGFCVTTCPIGCLNGQCAGGECICNSGYTLEINSKYCVPSCKDNCGGFGNCTAPNTCSCRNGYQTATDGSCKPVCNKCMNGDCIAPNNCQCRTGYIKNENGECTPYCSRGCAPNGQCIAPETCSNSLNTTVSISQIPNQTPNQSYPNGYPTYYHPSHPSNPIGPNYQYPIYNRPDFPPYNINGTQYIVQQMNPSYNPSSDSQLANTTKPLPNNQQFYTLPYSNQGSVQPTPYYPQQGNYPYYVQNPSAFPNRPIYPGQTNYPEQTLYQVNRTNSQVPSNYPYLQGNNYPNNPNIYYPNRPFYPNQPNKPYQPNNPNEPIHLHYPNATSQTYNPNQLNHTNQLNYTDLPNPTYPNQPNYLNQNNYASPPYFPNQPYPFQPHYPNQPFPYQPNHPNIPYNPNDRYPPTYPNQPYNPNYRPNYQNNILYKLLPNGTLVPEIEPSSQSHNPNQIVQQTTPNQINHTSSGQALYVTGQITPHFPECSEPCINGICMEGNRCVCNPGYTMDPSDRRCKPHCAGGCTNGVCSGPNLCICNMGYHKDTSVKGRAVCIKRIRRSLNYILSKKPESIY